MAMKDSSNPFFLDEDVDDAAFLSNSRNTSSYLPTQDRSYEQKREQLLMQKREIEQRTLQSSMRSIGLLQESEDVGVKTAQELLTQREQLENTERRLEDINTNLRTSEKHIQNIKSVFSSMKSYFSGKPAAKAPVASSSESKPRNPSALDDIVEKTEAGMEKPQSSSGDHPALKLRGVTSDPFQDDYGTSTSAQVDKQLDENLDVMFNSLTRLKGLGQGLQLEIDQQNEMLDRITNKAEGVDWRIEKQNKEMTKILKK